MTTRLEFTPLEGEPFGARVTGWEPSEALSDADRDAIRARLRDHLVLVFRGHPRPSDEALVAFGKRFGPMILGSEWFRNVGAHPEILPVSNIVDEDGVPIGTGGAGAFEWHSDYSYTPRPAKESFLEASELPTDPPKTCFCNQYVAFETLSENLRERLRGLRAFHSITDYVEVDRELEPGFEAKRQRDEREGREVPSIPQAEHPVVMRHPESGRELLYVSKGITRHIVGLPREESIALLKELHQHATRSDGIYAHQWEEGDLIVFDALGSMHRRDAFPDDRRRYMRQLSTMI